MQDEPVGYAGNDWQRITAPTDSPSSQCNSSLYIIMMSGRGTSTCIRMTDFRTVVLFDLVDTLYRQKHVLTVKGNYSMRDLVRRERMHPAIIRRVDDMCRVIEV